MGNNKILFTGYYGFENVGDDMFGLVSVWGANKYWNNLNTYLLSRQGAVNSEIKIKLALNNTVYIKGQVLLECYYQIFKSQFVILSGGSILHTRAGRFSARNIAFTLARLNIIKMGAIGVSIGPFKTNDDYRYIESVVQKFKFLVLRDIRSYEIACNMHLPYKPVLAADLAFLLPAIPKKISFLKRSNCKILAISLCHYERYTSSYDIENELRRENAIFSVLNRLKNKSDIVFRFFIINGSSVNGDNDLTLNIIKKLDLAKEKYELIPYNSDTLEVYDLLSNADAMYSTRLHGAIFAAAANTPSILVEYHKKCSDYLDDIGIDEKWRVGDMSVSPESVANNIQNLLLGNYNNFYPRRDILMKRSVKNFESVNDLLLK